MSLIPDPETCYAIGRRHSENNVGYCVENAKFKQAYIKGYKDGKKARKNVIGKSALGGIE